MGSQTLQPNAESAAEASLTWYTLFSAAICAGEGGTGGVRRSKVDRLTLTGSDALGGDVDFTSLSAVGGGWGTRK